MDTSLATQIFRTTRAGATDHNRTAHQKPLQSQPTRRWIRSMMVQSMDIKDFDRQAVAKILRCYWMCEDRLQHLDGSRDFTGGLPTELGQQVLDLIPSGTPIQCYYPKCVTCGLFPYNYGTTCKNISEQNICIQDVKNSNIASDKVDLQCNFGGKPNAALPSASTNNNNTTMIIIGVCAALLILLVGVFMWWKKQKAL